MAATSTPNRPGRLPTLAKYEVLEELGHGGMATVYRAHDKRLGRDVAVKVIHPHLRDSVEVAHRFYVEAKAVAKLRHANIVEVYDVSAEGENEQYLVVELLRGKTLRKLLQEQKCIPPEAAAALAIELLSALAHAHGAGVVHRDVKPENVILEHHAAPPLPLPSSTTVGERPVPRPAQVDAPGERVIIKLTDFGIAKLLDVKGVTSTGQVLGSPAHMAPEQIEGGDVDARADVFGLGVLLYECMVGHLPFEGNNPAQVLRRVLDGIYPSAERERPEIGKNWSVVLDRALARRPEDRFIDATDMREAIQDELKRLGIDAPRAELEAWFDDPAAFVENHRARMTKRLCALGGEARRASNVLAAASDYNRALAYAPSDPVLLKIVSTMHRAQARAQLARRLLPVVFGAIAMGVAAFFVTRFVQQHPPVDPVRPTLTVLVPAKVGPDLAPPVPALPATVPLKASAAPALVMPVPVRSSVPPVTIRREFPMRVRPAHGVLIAIDGDAATAAEAAPTLTLDDKKHTLTFSCVENLCEPVTRYVEPGELGFAVDVELKIRPAKLIVDGTPGRRYTVMQRPGVTLDARVPVEISMKRGIEMVTVRELETDREVRVELRVGQDVHAVFADIP